MINEELLAWLGPMARGLRNWWLYPLAGSWEDLVGNRHGRMVGGADVGVRDTHIVAKFDGADDEVGGIGPLPALSGATNFSMACWMQRGALSDYLGAIQNNTSGSSNRVGIAYWADNNVYGFVAPEGVGTFFGVVSNDLLWHRIFLTFASGSAKLYRDGIERATNSGGTPTGAHSGPDVFRPGIGVQGASVFRGPGQMYDLRVYDRAITADEVARDYVESRYEIRQVRSRLYFFPTSSDGSITLTGDAATLILVGQAATALITLAGANAEAVLTGQSATAALTLTGVNSVLTLTGQDATLTASGNVTLVGADGTLSLAGQSATATTNLVGAAGALTLTGQTGSITVTLTGAQAVLTLAGQNATLTSGGNVALAGDAATLTLVGQNAALSAGGNVALAGSAAALTLAGQSAAIGLSLAGTAASATLAGQTAAIAVSLAGANGMLSLAGQNATLSVTGSVTLTGQLGTLTLAGQNATLSATGAVTSVEARLNALLLADAGVASIVVARVYPDALAQEIPRPSLVYQRTSTQYLDTLLTPAVALNVLIEVWCLAPTRIAAEQLGDAAATAITTAQLYLQERRFEFDPETETFASVLTCNIWQ